ncbi:MAG: TonB-dependent receptor [Gammaproteobacteria bacterium]|nr:TonB-dependent receptor [Gammaproteobacteria bacterium]
MGAITGWISASRRSFAFGLGALLVTGLAPIAQAQDDTSGTAVRDTALEEIVVTGVRSSIERSIDDKRFATEIKDSISAEDIGQLPDDNIAEALQRVTGIQMARSADGEGDTVQVRGISNNNVELNGQSISGSSSNRTINFQDVPSELFSGIEVLKAPTADRIEGSLGGTINLKTRRPLTGKKEMISSVTAKVKYSEIADEYDPDLNAFFLKQWRGTGAGDFGLILNVGTRTVSTVSEVYGGGDFDDAPAIWVRRTGTDTARAPFLAAGPWQYDASVDVNGDSVSDENDIFYIPNGFGFFENTRTSDRNSFNGTFQWQPNDKVNLFADITATDIEESLTGSRYSLNFNAVRSAPLTSGNNVYELLNETASLGPVYQMTAGRMGAITTRMGASPSSNDIERDSTQVTLGGDWQASDRLNVSAEWSTSKGSANTVDQGAIVMGINFNCDLALNANDFAGIVDFDLSSGGIPDATLYESPFNAPCWGVDGVQSELTAIDPTDVTYERLSYFQFNRVANDTENTADSLRLDGELDFNESGITRLSFGLRIAERAFERRSYQNGNQAGGWPSTLDLEGTNPTERLNVQRIFVNPASNSDPLIADAATFLQDCQLTRGSPGLLSGEGGNLPRTWTSSVGCTAAQISAAFNLFDIRAVRPDSGGVGYYEQTGLRYEVEEATDAIYLMADFRTAVGDMELFGNVGGRYVKTETKSTGWVSNGDGTFSLVTFDGDYSDFLPSLNLNLALNDEMLVRLGVSRSLGRPGLNIISPGISINRNDQVEGFDGNGTAGNPGVKPVRSDNIDLSYEWYYGPASLLSIAYFQKDIDSTIFLDNDQVPRQIGDELFLIRTYGNFPGTKIDGFEFGLQHAFESLPGILENTGVQLNYTITDENSDLVDQEGDPISRRGLSENSYNATLYYDDGRLNARLAYNWREAFVRRENVTLGFGSPNVLPEFEDDRGQLDFSVNYSVTDNLKMNFSAVNINDSKTERYMKYKTLTNYIAFAGVRYNLGVVYRFD